MNDIEKQEKIERYFNKASQWKEENNTLRQLITAYDLEEDYKWMHPCYTIKGKNVCLIHGFKEYVAILFHKGVLIEDKHNMLIQQTENVQTARQLRFTSLEEILNLQEEIKYYIEAAIQIEKSGVKVPKVAKEPLELPQEMQEIFDQDIEFETAFYQLTPGRQRAYIIDISKAKRSETRKNRLEKYRAKIFDGKGMLER